jgi:hypothetical protein
MLAKSHHIEQRLDSAVLQDARDFVTLEVEREGFHEYYPSATPFQLWACPCPPENSHERAIIALRLRS